MLINPCLYLMPQPVFRMLDDSKVTLAKTSLTGKGYIPVSHNVFFIAVTLVATIVYTHVGRGVLSIHQSNNQHRLEGFYSKKYEHECVIPISLNGSVQISERCKNIYGSNRYFEDPRTELKDRKQVKIGTSIVIDFRCRFIFRFAYFHLWNNCLLEMVELLKYALEFSGSNATIVIERFYLDFLNRAGIHFGIDQYIIHETNVGHDILCNKMLYYDPSSVPLKSRVAALREIFIFRTERGIRKRAGTILYIKRIGRGREIYPEQDLLGNMTKTFPQHRLEVFYGNEDINQTIRMFQDATIVLGGHGAGMINVLFCHHDTMLIEITRRDPSTGKIWRSNLVAPVRMSVKCATIVVVSTNRTLDRLETINKALGSQYKTKGLGAVIKALPFILDAQNILAIISEASQFFNLLDGDSFGKKNRLCTLDGIIDYSGVR